MFYLRSLTLADEICLISKNYKNFCELNIFQLKIFKVDLCTIQNKVGTLLKHTGNIQIYYVWVLCSFYNINFEKKIDFILIFQLTYFLTFVIKNTSLKNKTDLCSIKMSLLNILNISLPVPFFIQLIISL